MLLLYHYRFAGGGALRDLAAAQCSTPPPQLCPRGGGDADTSVAAGVFRGTADPLTDAVAVPQYRGDSGWRLARGTVAIHTADGKTTALATFLLAHGPRCGGEYDSPSRSCIFVRIPFRRSFFERPV